MPTQRPAVSVVVPFKGDAALAQRLCSALGAIETQPDDELIVVDNTESGVVAAVAPEQRIHVLRAAQQASSYYARNVGAEAARNAWILFTDADCRPRQTILDDYFDRAIPERCGALIGEVVGMEDQTHVVARYARARGHMRQTGHMTSNVRPFGATVNMLVRREAWLDVGGFFEGIRTGGDRDFSWRLQDRDWTVEYAPNAIVAHAHRESVRGLIEQWARYGTATAWLERRYPGTYPASSVPRALAGAVRVLLSALGPLVRRRREAAAFTSLDALVAAASAVGELLDNRAAAAVEPRPQLVAVTGTYPADREWDAAPSHVEAACRPEVPRPWLTRTSAVRYAEDDGPLRRVADLAWLGLRHPARTVAGVRSCGLRELLRLAPSARRLAQLNGAGARFQIDPARESDAQRLRRLAGLDDPEGLR